MLARLYANREVASASKRRKSVDAAIQWYEAAEDCFRRASPGKDKAVSWGPGGMSILSSPTG